jgi:DNA-binding LacI/PurR family transcriptional regulator
VTLQSIANRVGVSRMTVSNAFSRPDQLSESMRERILATAQELGYGGPDPAARTLARGASGAIGVVLTDSLSYAFSDAVATSFLGAVAEVLEPGGVALTLISLARATTTAPHLDVAIDGAIVYSVDADSPVLPWLRARAVPLVLVDQRPVDDASTINVDDRSGARAAARHLLRLGHRRIGIITEGLTAPYDTVVEADARTQHYVIAERLGGWLDALDARHIKPKIVNLYRNSLDDACRAASLLLNSTPRPTALICVSDLMAAGACRAVSERGLRVPEDVSVVGFDDAPIATQGTPSLTTVRQPFAAKGRLAAQALLSALAQDNAPSHIVLDTELVVRQSTAKAAPNKP